jgi:D-lactate dehydrogenase
MPPALKTWDIEDIDVKIPSEFKGNAVTSFFRKHKPLSKAHNRFYSKITRFIPSDRVYADDLRTFAFAVDASVYRLIPQIIVRVETTEEVQHCLRVARECNVPVTFRAAGTSLSGQAQSDSVLILIRHGWKKTEINHDASIATFGPGVIGAHANRFLAPYGKKIGPDPSSISSCMMGGIASNNSSGMCCGTKQNTYNTLHSLRIVFCDGTLLDTADEQSRAAFRKSHPLFLQEISKLAADTKASTKLADRIRQKYTLKNTTGYSLNSLVDFTDPIDIAAHLMIGSEGTLGFLDEIRIYTCVDHPNKASCLVIFEDLYTAGLCTAELKKEPVYAVEIMDNICVQSVAHKPGMPEITKTLRGDESALLVETRASNREDLVKQADHLANVIKKFKTVNDVEFSYDPVLCAQWWEVRKGLIPTVAGVRSPGSSVIIEDFVAPTHRLADMCIDMRRIFTAHGWKPEDVYILGHALEGNIHIIFAQPNLAHAENAQRFDVLMKDLCDSIVNKFDGSLKGEHGTGRNIAPFVELEWGAEAVAIMRRIKALFDPRGLLNPGVILNDDPQCHARNLKGMPLTSEVVDKCMECGFCESVCASLDVTLTPRQRITVQREISRLKETGDDPRLLRALETEFAYQGEETCAACSWCSSVCPVYIDTGKLTKNLRRQKAEVAKPSGFSLAPRNSTLASFAARRFGALAFGAGNALWAVSWAHYFLGHRLTYFLARAARWLLPGVPSWLPTTPAPTKSLTQKPFTGKPKVVVFHPCGSRLMGGKSNFDPSRDDLTVVTQRVLERAGYEVVYPKALEGLCCGLAFHSKGFFEINDWKTQQSIDAMYEASEEGKWPVLCDGSSCSQHFREAKNLRGLQVYEPYEFTKKFLLEKLTVQPTQEKVSVHVTCSAHHMKLDGTIKEVMKTLAPNNVFPEHVYCCGWAGDRGFNYPELNKASLKYLKQGVTGCTTGYSNNQTCEIGLSFHSGIPYRSVLHLLDDVSTPMK